MGRVELNEEGIRQAVQGALESKRAAAQALFDAMGSEAVGKPLDEVKKLLAERWERDLGGSITDPELTVYAEALVSGAKVGVRIGEADAEA